MKYALSSIKIINYVWYLVHLQNVQNYREVVIAGEGMTLVLRMSGGNNSQIPVPFFVFKNQQRNYPIIVTPDTATGVYLEHSHGHECFNQWLDDLTAIDSLPKDLELNLLVGNTSDHNSTPKLSTSLVKYERVFESYQPIQIIFVNRLNIL